MRQCIPFKITRFLLHIISKLLQFQTEKPWLPFHSLIFEQAIQRIHLYIYFFLKINTITWLNQCPSANMSFFNYIQHMPNTIADNERSKQFSHLVNTLLLMNHLLSIHSLHNSSGSVALPFFTAVCATPWRRADSLQPHTQESGRKEKGRGERERWRDSACPLNRNPCGC